MMTPQGDVDLHIHTTASSDGQHTPEEIFSMAREVGLRAIAFADHNSVGSIDRGLYLSHKYAIELIPCFELNTLYDNMDLHILGYFVDHREPEFHRWLEEIREAKLEQAKKRVQRLKGLGFVIDKGDIDRAAKGKIPSGSTFLRALLGRKEGGEDPRLFPYTTGDRSDSPALNFYRDYFRKNRPAFVPLEVCPTETGIRRIREFGGVPVQAHPSDTGIDVIEKLIDAGLMGIEAYSSYHSDEESEQFLLLANRHGIIATAGSDFHGKEIKPNVDLAGVKGNSYGIVERLKDARSSI